MGLGQIGSRIIYLWDGKIFYRYFFDFFYIIIEIKLGSKVSREADVLILLDDNFSTIIDTIKMVEEFMTILEKQLVMFLLSLLLPY